MLKETERQQKERLVQLVRDALIRDTELREQYKIGEKFRFIRDRLEALLARLEKNLEVFKEEEKKAEMLPAEDEAIVYVHLFNAHGNLLKTWQNLMTTKVFYEYSVNRPIYSEKAHIEELLRGKKNKNEHAYLAFIIKKVEIIKPVSESSPRDAIGNPLIKIREGSLRMEKLVVFVHKEELYILDDAGIITKKPL